MKGNASAGERAKHAGEKSNVLIDSAWAFIKRESVLPDHPPSGNYTIPLLLASIYIFCI